VAENASEVVVLYAGVVVEQGPTETLLQNPRHPYTRALLRSVPPLGSYRARGEKGRKLPTLQGALPDLCKPHRGCRFEPRCPQAGDRCGEEVPPLSPVLGGAVVRCFLADPEVDRASVPFDLELHAGRPAAGDGEA